MSENTEPPKIMGAICGPSHTNTIQENGVTNEIPQPRQPTSLQGLLKYSMEANKTNGIQNKPEIGPLDDEKKKFLEQALSSLTVNVIEELMKNIKILEKIDPTKVGDDADEYIKALETISDYVCDIDTSNDYHKIGGFVVLHPCLKSNEPQVRALACNLLAELTQNNPYCQRVVLENGFMQTLVNILGHDSSIDVIVKSLYAISCICRDNNAGVNQLIQYCGIQILLETLKKKEEKCTIKVCFLLGSLCNTYPDFKSRLIFVGYVPVLKSLITAQHSRTHEHVLYLLLQLVEDNQTAINECLQNEDEFKETLQNYINSIKNNDEFASEEEYSLKLQGILFPKN